MKENKIKSFGREGEMINYLRGLNLKNPKIEIKYSLKFPESNKCPNCSRIYFEYIAFNDKKEIAKHNFSIGGYFEKNQSIIDESLRKHKKDLLSLLEKKGLEIPVLIKKAN